MADIKVSEKMLQDSNWIDKTQAILQDNVMSLFEKFFNGAHALLYSQATYSVIIVIVMFWLLNRLKNGYPTREELFNASKWIITTAIIFGILANYEAYKYFLKILTIPESIVTAIVANNFNTQDFGEIITNAFNKLDNVKSTMWNFGIEDALDRNKTSIFGIVNFNDPVSYIIAYVGIFFAMTPFWIFYIVFFLLLAGIVIVIFFSKFMAFLILSTAPIILPFLIIRGFWAYLWSWYKLYLSFALVPILSFIVLNLALNPIDQLDIFTKDNIAELFYKQFEYLITGTITALTAIFLLKRIPSWINAVLGTQMQEGSGGIGATAVAGAIATKTGMGGLVAKSAGGSFFKGAFNVFSKESGLNAISRVGKIGAGASRNFAKDLGGSVKKFNGGYATP